MLHAEVLLKSIEVAASRYFHHTCGIHGNQLNFDPTRERESTAMTHLKKIIIGAITLTTITVGASALAARGNGDHQERMIERISSKLELTDTQIAAMQSFAEELTETRELMRGNRTDLRAEMNSLIEADTLDQGKALTLINDRAAAIQKNAPELVAAAAVFFDGLSAEQRAQVLEFAEKRGHGRHKGKNKN